jgi:uncharacterized Zn finger protein (UPF0148 family)
MPDDYVPDSDPGEDVFELFCQICHRNVIFVKDGGIMCGACGWQMKQDDPVPETPLDNKQ